MVSGETIASWLGRLVQIPSVAPAQAGPKAGIPGEEALSNALEGWFRELGGTVSREEVLPGRTNLYATWNGEAEGWAAVDVHMDTVGVEQMTTAPFSGEIRDGKVHGRGAVDTKATLAVVLALLEAMQERGVKPACNLLVTATVDEEVDANGAPAFAAWVRRQGLSLDQLAVAEPTRCAPVVGHKGALRLELTVLGEPAHSSQPHLGRNAVEAAAHLIVAFEAENRRLQVDPPVTAVGNPTLTVTVVHGGTGTNVVPDRCAVALDRRMVPGEKADEVEARLLAIAREACPLPFECRRLKQIDPFTQDPDSPWVRQLVEWSGMAPAVAPYGTNAWAYGGLARECVVIGPGSIDQAHGVEEWVEISELEKLAGIYARWWGLL
jgi:acetylornithine deacetylase/succinyl-diaminopimelate desuccinylase-like protein